MKRIFITGASGCIGHYMTESLIQNTNHELYLLVRNPDKLQFDYQVRPGIHILPGDMSRIEEYRDLLFKDINVAILAATAWGGEKETYDINVVKTLALINLLNPQICEQVIYFSTASILDRQNQLLFPASQFGHDYIRTKYQCFEQLAQQAISDKIIAVFPTLVFGGNLHKPYSHLSSGITDVTKWIDLIRWFSIDGSFHFIHAQDIAGVISYLVEHPEFSREITLASTFGDFLQQRDSSRRGNHLLRRRFANAESRAQTTPTQPKPSKESIDCLVLGNPAITVDQAISEMANYFGKRIYLRFPLYIWLANIFIKIFQIQMDSWSRFSLDYRHFTHTNPVTPKSFGLKNYCSTVAELMKVSGV